MHESYISSTSAMAELAKQKHLEVGRDGEGHSSILLSNIAMFLNLSLYSRCTGTCVGDGRVTVLTYNVTSPVLRRSCPQLYPGDEGGGGGGGGGHVSLKMKLI